MIDCPGEEPLLYYKTNDEIAAYIQKPVEEKLDWLAAQMEFFYYAMPVAAKGVRLRLGQAGKPSKPAIP